MPEPKAAYGQSLASGYPALSQIAAADGRRQDSPSRGKPAVTYAEKWSSGSNREIIVGRCGGSNKYMRRTERANNAIS
jgi:hypothetical protein